jgi:uncharacterized membrane protein
MDAEIVLLTVMSLGLLIGAVLGWVAFFRTGKLHKQLNTLQRDLDSFQQHTDQATPHITTSEKPAHTDTPSSTTSSARSKQPQSPQTEAPGPGITTASQRPRWQTLLADNWMIWLGGVCVALAGIFMVKYSMEVGLLGPRARISLAIFTGMGLHAAAEWLRRRNGGNDPVFAALAGGASITLYAALLAALHLYHLLDPRLVFALLAIVSLMTMAMSLLHGPLLAIIGLIGAYIVPILVNNDSSNMVTAMIYSLIISGAALLLQHYVFRYWLWWGVMAGALGWWIISLSEPQADLFRGPYLALLAWGLIALPGFDWLLRGRQTTTADTAEAGARPVMLFRFRLQLNQISLLLVILAWGFSLYRQGFDSSALGLWAPLVAVVFFAARQRDSLAALPWITLLVQWLAWLISGAHYDPAINQIVLAGLPAAAQPHFLTYAGFMSLIYSGLALLHVRQRGFSHGQVSLALLAPLAWLALAYLLVNGLSRSVPWSVLTLLAGASYGAAAGVLLARGNRNDTALWLTLGAHLAYSLAVTMYFREAGLTLALSAQLLSLSWLMKRHQLPWLGYLIKALLAVVVARLTFNPWLLGYPSDIHWSLWTYGGATVFSALAAMQCRSSPKIQQWLEAATLHLLVLTLAAELRYWLYDSEIFTHRYSLKEAAINTSLWAALAISYYRRSAVSENLKHLYILCSRILLALSLASYGVVVILHNPWWSNASIGTAPLFNILLLAYGLPVLMALLVARYHEPQFRKAALFIAGLGSLLFVSLEIRHLWQGGSLSLHNPTSDGELYSYSIIWLMLAIVAILAGTSWRVRDLYKSGIALLGVVIAKIFIVDMSDLEGLLRVASFMGLGLSLLGLAWLHRRMQQNGTAASNSELSG